MSCSKGLWAGFTVALCITYPTVHYWTLSLFPNLGVCEYCCNEFGMHVSLADGDFTSLEFRVDLEEGLLGYESSVSNFVGKLRSVFHKAVPICILVNSTLGVPFYYTLTSLCYFLSLSSSLGIEPRALYILGKHSSTELIFCLEILKKKHFFET